MEKTYEKVSEREVRVTETKTVVEVIDIGKIQESITMLRKQRADVVAFHVKQLENLDAKIAKQQAIIDEARKVNVEIVGDSVVEVRL